MQEGWMDQAAVHYLVCRNAPSSPISPAQTANDIANSTDVIIPLKGKPIKGNIIKFDGTTLYSRSSDTVSRKQSLSK